MKHRVRAVKSSLSHKAPYRVALHDLTL